MIETLPGGEEIIMHNFASEHYCGRCGNKMGANAHGFECGTCHMIYSENNGHFLM